MIVNQIVSSLLGSNTYVIENDNNVIIVDAGVELEKVVRVVGDKYVCGILLTHLHFDHVYYLKNYVSKFKCKVYLYDKEYVFNDNFTLQSLFGKLEMPVGVYCSLKDKTNINLKNFNIQCLHTAGHSADSMCFKIDDVLFSGDTLFKGTIGRTDLPTSNVSDMLSSLEKLKTIKFNICYSGHGELSDFEHQIDNINYFLMEL